ncbi:MAG: phosphate regulon sensor kinase PhoR [Gammaproteobacteria bacterium]|nr:phosphate regulon sensor kinase PhoR [Gammaproteobacteria bacterium]
MKADIWRFAGVLFLSLLAGMVSGQALICVVVGMVLYFAWQYRTLKQLLLWIQNRKNRAPPDMSGLINYIAKEVDFLRLHHKKRKKKLSKYLQRFQESTAALPDAVVILGHNGVIEWANENAEKYLGICWPHDAGQRISNLVRKPSLLKYLQEAESSSRYRGLELAPQSNPDLWLELRIVPYGKKQQLLLARDITGIHRANRMRKDFIANASHELRTPLTVISGYLEALEDEADGPMKAWLGQLRQMRNQTDRMRRLIEDLLELSTLETDPEPARLEIVSVAETLASVCEEAKTLGGLLEHKFSIETDPELLLKVNRNEIYSAFSNLVVNAVQHTAEHGAIRIRWFADKSSACLEVTDTGEGIAPEHLPRLTERFYRVDKGRSRDKCGTGLGLAIVKHVLRRHNAELDIESEPGKGSTFRCRFPAAVVVHKEKLDDIPVAG